MCFSRNKYYYTIENFDGEIYFTTDTRKSALNIARSEDTELPSDIICFKRKVGDDRYVRLAFIMI